MIMHKKQPKVHRSYKYHKLIVQLVNWLLIQICNCYRLRVDTQSLCKVMASVTSGFAKPYKLWLKEFPVSIISCKPGHIYIHISC